MQRVTPSDRDRAVRRLATATGAITASSIALTGAFMALAKHETDAKNALKAQQKAAQQFTLTAEQPGRASGSSAEEPVLHIFSPDPMATSSPSSTPKASTTKKPPRKPTPSKRATTTKSTPRRSTSAQDAPQQDQPRQEPPQQQPQQQQQDPPPPPATSSGS